MHEVRLTVDATDGDARAGTARTARGAYTTPCFMPVGTRGAVKYLSAADYECLGVQIVLANTYHLMLRPGADVVAGFGGLGRFAGWDGLTLTDSGGFQVFSLDPTVDDDGVTFRSTYDGSLAPLHARGRRAHAGAARRRHPDGARRVPAAAEPARRGRPRRRAHRRLGGPRPCRPLPGRPGAVRDRAGWRRRRAAHGRAPSAPSTLDFDGYGIGGLSVGETRPEMLAGARGHHGHAPGGPAPLPDGRRRSRHRLVEAIALGVDQFDCVMQTRLGRHGTALTGAGKLHVKAARHAVEDDPLDVDCALRRVRPPLPRLPAPPVQRRRTDGVAVGEPAQHRLDAAADGSGRGGRSWRHRFDGFRRDVMSVWG